MQRGRGGVQRAACRCCTTSRRRCGHGVRPAFRKSPSGSPRLRASCHSRKPCCARTASNATFVGHPLLDRASELPDAADARATLGLPPDDPVLAVFPGSRGSELARHLVPFTATARELQRRLPRLQVVVSAAPGIEIDAAICPFPAGARRIVHRAACGYRWTAQERHDDARSGGGGIAAYHRLSHEQDQLRNRAARGAAFRTSAW